MKKSEKERKKIPIKTIRTKILRLSAHLNMSHKDNANLISTGGVAEALALNVDELVV